MGDLPASVMQSSRELKEVTYNTNLVYPRARELAQGMEVYLVGLLKDINNHQGPDEKQHIRRQGFRYSCMADGLHIDAALYSSGTVVCFGMSTMGGWDHLMTAILVTVFHSQNPSPPDLKCLASQEEFMTCQLAA